MRGEEREGGREVEVEGGDSRDGTAIITDLLEEISTTQTGCSHHIEMIDNGEGERGRASERGSRGEGARVGALGGGRVGGRRRSAAGASSRCAQTRIPLPHNPPGRADTALAPSLATGAKSRV